MSKSKEKKQAGDPGSPTKAETFKQAILNNLYYIQGKPADLATLNDWYIAVAFTVRDRLMENWERV